MSGPETAPRWRRLEPDTRRRQILHCAARLFETRPYADVSTSDIALEAGVARALINHYFGTKKGLYLEVLRMMVTVPGGALEFPPQAGLAERVQAISTWFLDAVQRHGTSWLAAGGAEGIGRDPDVERVLAEADEITADRLLDAIGLAGVVRHREELRGLLRVHCWMARAAAREWLDRGAISRRDAELLLTRALITTVEQVFPEVSRTAPPVRPV